MTAAPATPLDSTAAANAVLVGGEWMPVPDCLAVFDKFNGEPIGTVGRATAAMVERAVAAADSAARTVAFPAYERYAVLSRAAEILAERSAALNDLMVRETGFTRSECGNDLNRCLQTLRASAEEAKRLVGEMVPVAGAPGQDERRIAFTLRLPIGVVCAITPFNSPLNTVAHKVAPALAAGNAVVLKPSSYVPLTAAVFAEVLLEAGTPPSYLSVLFGSSEVGDLLLADQRIGFYAFTGSSEVGRLIQARAGLRRTQLELGNISATIVCADGDLDLAAQRCVASAFRKAGQVCTSVQRLLVEETVADEFAERVVAQTQELTVGDPSDPTTAVGPMIDAREARRAQAWVTEAKDAGAQILSGGTSSGSLFAPTILTQVSNQMKVVCEEIFAPVFSLTPFSSFDEAVDLANATPFGLSVGIFTRDVTKALESARRLRMGSIHVNDSSSSRVDLMPYGGLKESGFGQEGPKYAVREMTEERLVTLNPS